MQEYKPDLQNAINAHLALCPQTNPTQALLLRNDDAYIGKVLTTVKERLHVHGDFVKLALPFFVEPDFDSPAAQGMRSTCWKGDVPAHIAKLQKVFGAQNFAWTSEAILYEVRSLGM